MTAEANRVVRRCGDTPLGGPPDSVKRFFALFFQLRVKPAEPLTFCHVLELCRQPPCSWSAPPKLTRS